MSDNQEGQWDWEGAGGADITPAPDSWQAAALRGQLATHIGNALSDAWSNRPTWGQVPGAIANFITAPARTVVGAADRLLHEPVANQLQDKYAQHQLTQGVVGIGAGSAFAPVEGPALRMFGGSISRTADLPALRQAKAMESFQIHPQDIWEKTGWYKGPGEDWRYEIPDEAATLKWPAEGQVGSSMGVKLSQRFTLGDVLEHKELFDAYPSLKDTVIRSTSIADMMDRVRGMYDPETGHIALSPGDADMLKSTLLHEIQHKVQHMEDFPRGGSPGEFLPSDFDNMYKIARGRLQPYDEELNSAGLLSAEVRQAMKARDGETPYGMSDRQRSILSNAEHTLGPENLNNFKKHYDAWRAMDRAKSEAFDKYLNTAGEVEARIVQQRQKYTATEREQSPWTSAEWPRDPSQSIIKRYTQPYWGRLEPQPMISPWGPP